MNLVELVGFLAVALNVFGNLLVTSDRLSGWFVRLACNVAQLAYAILIFSPSLGSSAILFSAINAVGAWRCSLRNDGHDKTCGVMRVRRRVCNCGRFA